MIGAVGLNVFDVIAEEFRQTAALDAANTDNDGVVRNIAKGRRLAAVRIWIDFNVAHRSRANFASAPWSVAARNASPAFDPKLHAFEHVVPVSQIVLMIAASPDDAEAILRGYGTVAVITRDEDARLRANGLRSSHPNPDDLWARYRQVGITMSE